MLLFQSVLVATVLLAGMMANSGINLQDVNEALSHEEKAYENACKKAEILDKFLFKKNEVSGLDEATLDKLKEQVSSAKSSICKFYRKSKFLSEKAERLSETKMIKDCLEKFICNESFPAIEEMNDHFVLRQGYIEAINMSIEMLQDTIPGQKELQENLINLIDITISAMLGHFQIEAALQSYYGLYIAAVISLLMLWKFGIKYIITFVILCLLGLFCGLLAVSIYRDYTLSEDYKYIREKIAHISSIKDTRLEAFAKHSIILTLAKASRNLESFKEITWKRLAAGKSENSEILKSFSSIDTFKQRLSHLKSQLQKNGYHQLANDAINIEQDFMLALEKLKSALRYALRFYKTMSNAFEAVVQSKESIPMREVLLYLKNIVDDSMDFQNRFSDLQTEFKVIVSKSNELKGDVNKFVEDNQWRARGAAGGAAVIAASAAALLAAPIAVPIAAVSFVGGGYVVGKAVIDNQLLDEFKIHMTKLQDYSKETADVIEEFDAMKTASGVNRCGDLEKLPDLSTEAYECYMKELSIMATENYNEIKNMIKRLQEIY